MKSIEVENIKTFMSMLFARESFDNLLLVEADIGMLINYNIDGKINKKFLDEEENEVREAYIPWKDVRGLCYDIVKGKKVPEGMRFIFKLSKNNTKEFLAQNGLNDMNADDVTGLFLNIKYEKQSLVCITGTSLKTFDINDKRLENSWDSYMEQFIKKIS